MCDGDFPRCLLLAPEEVSSADCPEMTSSGHPKASAEGEAAPPVPGDPAVSNGDWSRWMISDEKGSGAELGMVAPEKSSSSLSSTSITAFGATCAVDGGRRGTSS